MCLRVLLLAFNPCASKQVTQVCEQKQFVFLIYGAGDSEQIERDKERETHTTEFLCVFCLMQLPSAGWKQMGSW
jgi:hypothetical protein